MNISILTVFSHLYDQFLETSLIKRAQEEKIVTFDVKEFRSFTQPKERIDAPTIGHGAGMLLKPEVVQKAIESQEKSHGKAFKIFFSPHGKKLTQKRLENLKDKLLDCQHLMLISGRYEGMDARVEQTYADEIISLGDFVLMAGDIPAMAFLEGFLRLIPGVVGRQESVEAESFSGPFVDYPEYTHPVIWEGKEVPAVLLSGNHAEMAKWRQQEATKRTTLGHFDWLQSCKLSSSEKGITLAIMPSHYVVLMHAEVMVADENSTQGTTSVTSIDIHDIARSAKTYGIENFFIVTPLIDQQKIVRTLLDFWQEGSGIEYNRSRHEAVKQVELKSTLVEVKEKIRKKHGKDPIVIATSARTISGVPSITFHDQEQVWEENRPVLLVLGTGKGLTQNFLKSCDYLLVPIEGLTEYNHLSVRSAAAIIFDRWLGLNVRSIC